MSSSKEKRKIVAEIDMRVQMELSVDEKFKEEDLHNLFLVFHAGRTKIKEFRVVSVRDKKIE